MKAVEKAVCVIGILLMMWVIGSWGDVLMHNSPRNPSDPHDWNLFVIMTEMGN